MCTCPSNINLLEQRYRRILQLLQESYNNFAWEFFYQQRTPLSAHLWNSRVFRVAITLWQLDVEFYVDNYSKYYLVQQVHWWESFTFLLKWRPSPCLLKQFQVQWFCYHWNIFGQSRRARATWRRWINSSLLKIFFCSCPGIRHILFQLWHS